MQTTERDFLNIHFSGTFRAYQQHVLMGLSVYEKDQKVHIVAPPGSGKTILGLEIIRRFNTPTLIISPTTVIQNQWLSRFSDWFLSPEQARENGTSDHYTSNLLKSPTLLTSITYQGLYSAWSKQQDFCDATGESEDYTDFNILEMIENTGIKTICLDEAHHLKRSWQLALESLVDALSDRVKIISLTATPPYDSSPAEWSRYLSLCGEIDDEIPVASLVKAGVLAPHQDFVFFNSPSVEHLHALTDYRAKGKACLDEIFQSDLIEDLLTSGGMIPFLEERKYWMYLNTKDTQCLLKIAHQKSMKIPPLLRRDFLERHSGKPTTLEIQDAFQFVLDSPDLFDKNTVHRLRSVLASHSLLTGGKVALLCSPSINQAIAASSAKLKSVGEIAVSESASLGDRLHLVVITDYIRKETLPLVGTNLELSEISVVTLFETLRRTIGKKHRLAALSGSLVLLPNEIIQTMHSAPFDFSTSPLMGTEYSQVEFSASNFQKVAFITDLFETGRISAIVGTKALLGEGWDSPCINSLILASFVGSFVLSNQIRGRALRVSKDPEKVANIWHLVGILPTFSEDINQVLSDDLSIMMRRFDTFLAPSQKQDTIESGMNRLDVLEDLLAGMPLPLINQKTVHRATHRKQTSASWHASMPLDTFYQVTECSDIPYQTPIPRFSFYNIITFLSLTALLEGVILVMSILHSFAPAGASTLWLTLGISAVLSLSIMGYRWVFRALSPKKRLTHLSCAIIGSLTELGAIKSDNLVLVIEGKKEDMIVSCWLSGGTRRERSLFAKTIRELLSPFGNAKYIVIEQKKILFFTLKNYSNSFFCPSYYSVNSDRTAVLKKHLINEAGNFDIVYTNTLKGRDVLLEALRKSIVNKGHTAVRSKHIVKQELNPADAVVKAQQSLWHFLRNSLVGIFRRFFP